MKGVPAWFPGKFTVGIRKRKLRITVKFSTWAIGRMVLPLTMMGKAACGSSFEGGILKYQFWICLFYIVSRGSRKEINNLELEGRLGHDINVEVI